MGLWDLIKDALGGPPPPEPRKPSEPTGGSRGVQELARRLGVTAAELASFPVSYSEFALPKRSGGTRPIKAPEAKLKALQRTILRKVLARLDAHPAATGFERGKSIATNARVHAKKAVVLRMDLRDFFGTTTATRVRHYFLGIGWDKEAAAVLERLCTHAGALPQGAPTSPRLSNLLNYKLDVQLTSLAKRADADYTRYADDLTFSFAHDHRPTIHALVRGAKLLLEWSGYTINHRKKVRMRRAYERQEVTGLVVNERVRLPREQRRLLRAARHRVAQGKEATLSPQALSGWASLESMVQRQGS
jgi:hypothetical protein